MRLSFKLAASPTLSTILLKWYKYILTAPCMLHSLMNLKKKKLTCLIAITTPWYMYWSVLRGNPPTRVDICHMPTAELDLNWGLLVPKPVPLITLLLLSCPTLASYLPCSSQCFHSWLIILSWLYFSSVSDQLGYLPSCLDPISHFSSWAASSHSHLGICPTVLAFQLSVLTSHKQDPNTRFPLSFSPGQTPSFSSTPRTGHGLTTSCLAWGLP